MKILVSYFSNSGITKKTALLIASKLNADTEEIIDKTKRKGFFNFFKNGRDSLKKSLTPIEEIKKNPSEYDLIILGTPIWASNMTPAFRTYITENKNNFKETAVFSTSMGGEPDEALKDFQEITGTTPKAVQNFYTSEIKNNKSSDKIDKFVNQLT